MISKAIFRTGNTHRSDFTDGLLLVPFYRWSSEGRHHLPKGMSRTSGRKLSPGLPTRMPLKVPASLQVPEMGTGLSPTLLQTSPFPPLTSPSPRSSSWMSAPSYLSRTPPKVNPDKASFSLDRPVGRYSSTNSNSLALEPPGRGTAPELPTAAHPCLKGQDNRPSGLDEN